MASVKDDTYYFWEEEEEEETMLTHNIKLLSLCDLNLWQKKKKINVSMIKVYI